MDTTLSRTPQSNACIEAHPTDAEALIGPNAVTRTLEAVTERLGGGIAKTLREAAGIPASVPGEMIPERWFERLVAELRSRTPEDTSREILRTAGEATAAYVTRNRIPAPARVVLRLLPSRLALPLLLRAVERHAWTFAGRGAFTHADGVLTLSDPPTCRMPACRSPASAGALDAAIHTTHVDATTRLGGAYYEAAFEGILSLAAPGLSVREVACIRAGAPACRFSFAPRTHHRST